MGNEPGYLGRMDEERCVNRFVAEVRTAEKSAGEEGEKYGEEEIVMDRFVGERARAPREVCPWVRVEPKTR